MNTKNLVKKSLIYIDNHIEEKLTIEDISSAIGYSKYHFSRITKEQLRERLHEKIYKIILRLRDFQLNENSIVSDEECSIIKLAERLHNMRTVEYMEETKRVEKSLETIRIYVPIARKLGNKKIMNELDELASKYIR